MPRTVAGVRNAIRTGGLRDYLDREAKKEGEKSKYAGIWLYSSGRSVGEVMGRPSWSAVVEAPPKAAGKPPPAPVDYYRVEQDPFFAVHNLESEAEAAVAHDYATLWLSLRCPGCTLESLRGQAWNLPQMRVWEDAHAVRALAKLGIDEAKAAQKYIRTKLRAQASVLAERGLLPRERVQRMERHQKELAEWRARRDREEQQEEEEWKEAQREAQAAEKRIEEQRAQRVRAASGLLAQLGPLQGRPNKAAGLAKRRRDEKKEKKQEAAQAEKRAQAEARTAQKNAAEIKRAAAQRVRKAKEKAAARKRQASAAAEASRQQKRQRAERLAARSCKRRASL